MSNNTEALISSEIADFFAGVVDIHTELFGPNTIEEAQQKLTERVTRIATECEATLIAALKQSQQEKERVAEGVPVGFRWRHETHNYQQAWTYVYHRSPDEFERQNVVQMLFSAPLPVVPDEITPDAQAAGKAALLKLLKEPQSIQLSGYSEEMIDVVNSPVIPDGWIAAINRLLDSDGSRGCYSAIRCYDAHQEIEAMLAMVRNGTVY